MNKNRNTLLEEIIKEYFSKEKDMEIKKSPIKRQELLVNQLAVKFKKELSKDI